MLEITIPANEFYLSEVAQFISTPTRTIKLEHSLVSISKWESKWKKPFLGESKKTQSEYLDYIKCMTITQNVDALTYKALTEDNMQAIADYMLDPMTATTVRDTKGKKNRETLTAEVIYYYMISLNIPIEFQKWHINRLMMLIKVVNAKQNPPKVNKREAYNRRKQLNAERRQKLNSKG